MQHLRKSLHSLLSSSIITCSPASLGIVMSTGQPRTDCQQHSISSYGIIFLSTNMSGMDNQTSQYTGSNNRRWE
ncbi:hypothetical protein IQ06DRAFT_77413 [Phaeosphaeriaceae sp. SRC1lsM3a]|nr:hypothetical protein IQ06DRAFT_77413 [Stagonospora sp. SRC1lsM3a]